MDKKRPETSNIIKPKSEHNSIMVSNKLIRNKQNHGGKKIMASNNTGSNRMEVPEAREAMNKYKMEVASELGINLKQGYNGDLTSAQAGSIGGEMVRQMIKKQEESMAGK